MKWYIVHRERAALTETSRLLSHVPEHIRPYIHIAVSPNLPIGPQAFAGPGFRYLLNNTAGSSGYELMRTACACDDIKKLPTNYFVGSFF